MLLAHGEARAGSVNANRSNTTQIPAFVFTVARGSCELSSPTMAVAMRYRIQCSETADDVTTDKTATPSSDPATNHGRPSKVGHQSQNLIFQLGFRTI
jgi:hypothetical protein